jgi:hypothetical protein
VIVRLKSVYFYYRGRGNLAKDRQLFLRKNGFAYTDTKKVDAIIRKLIQDGQHYTHYEDSEGYEKVLIPNDGQDWMLVPVKLLVALTLRKGFDRGSRGRAVWDQKQLEYAIKKAKEFLPKYLKKTHRQNYSKARAREKACKEAATLTGFKASVINDNWSESRRQRIRAKKKR